MWRAHSDGPFSSAQRGVTGCQRISRQVSRHFLAYSALVFFLRGSGCFKQHFVAPIHSLSLNSSISLTLFTLVYVINLTCAFCRVSASAGVSFEISRSCNSSVSQSVFAPFSINSALIATQTNLFTHSKLQGFICSRLLCVTWAPQRVMNVLDS